MPRLPCAVQSRKRAQTLFRKYEAKVARRN
jgi:hypothetical protein